MNIKRNSSLWFYWRHLYEPAISNGR